ncbi:MAG: hypothetical protein J6386_05410 [Candidatus Synoicihabitans palmerolidicus]|nr:hypothetical protein [Candidatus Synoicihabitans palmerolidicus]
MLCDPVQMLQSNYGHLLRQNFTCRNTSQPDLVTALERHEELLINPARQGHHLTHWLKFFPLEQFTVIWHNELKSAPEATLSRGFADLGVDLDFKPPIQQHARAGVSPRGGWAGQTYAWMYQTAVVKGLGPLSRRWNYATPLKIVQKLKLRQWAERVFPRQGYPTPPANLTAELRSRFSDDVTTLEQLTGRKLPEWKA